MEEYKLKGYGPEPPREDKCEEPYLSPLPLDPNRTLPGIPLQPDDYFQSAQSGVLLASGEQNFFDSFQKNINPQVYPANSGINFEFPSGDFEHIRPFLEWYWDNNEIAGIVDTDGGTVQVGAMTPKQLADFVFQNSGLFFTTHESQWSYSEDNPFPESGLFAFGRGDNKKFYKYYRLAYTDTLNRRRFVDLREDITSLHSPYSSAVLDDITLSETQKEDFTIFNPYFHYSPYRSSPNSIDYKYVFINYLADYRVSADPVNPYKF